jgi:hypothetical protein
MACALALGSRSMSNSHLRCKHHRPSIAARPLGAYTSEQGAQWFNVFVHEKASLIVICTAEINS